MFHAGGYKGSRGRSTAFSGKNSNNGINKPDWKGPLRCGIQFCTLSCIFIVVGIVLTCLGIHDVFGETVPITGPILLTVGALFLVLACRQFYLVHTRKKLASLKEKEVRDGKTTVVVDPDDGTGPSTILMENTDVQEIREKEALTDGEDQPLDPYSKVGHNRKTSTAFDTGTYIWPTLPHQPSPLTCISMMLGKDPASLYGPFLGRPTLSCAYSPATTSTSLSPSRPDNSLSPTSPTTDSSQLAQTAVSSTTSSDPSLQLHSPTQPITPGTVAVVEAPLSSSTSDTHKPPHTNEKDSNSKHKRSYEGGLPAMIARDGIHNFPNRTAIMMLRTLELQETI